MQPVFRLSGISRRYRVGTTTIDALRGVDLVLPAGELVVLLGASGSGSVGDLAAKAVAALPAACCPDEARACGTLRA